MTLEGVNDRAFARGSPSRKSAQKTHAQHRHRRTPRGQCAPAGPPRPSSRARPPASARPTAPAASRAGRRRPQIKLFSISQPTEAEGTGRLASASTVVASSAQDELVLKMPSNLLSSLKRLYIYNCRDLEFCGGKGGFGGFTSLGKLVISGGCPKLLLGETKDDGTVDETLLPPSLQELSISSLPANMHSYFPRGLKKLWLHDVQLHSCTALEELRISWCPQLAVLEGLQFLSSLRNLEIEMNRELSAAWDLKLQEQEQGGNQIGLLPPSLDKLEICNLTDEVQSRLLSSLPRFTKLEICYSPILTSLQLGYCTALEELEIINCESLASIEGLHSIRNLRLLRVDDPPAYLHVWSFCRNRKGPLRSGLDWKLLRLVTPLSLPCPSAKSSHL